MNYNELPSLEVINKTSEALKQRNFQPVILNTKAEALEYIKTTIPAGASVMNGTSTTLEEIGYIDYLKSGRHPWDNIHEKVLQEKDPEKQALLRKHATVSDYYLGSVHALTQDGEIIIASNSGSQMPHIVYNSMHLIFIVSAKKIVENIPAGFKRLQEHVVPLENQRMQNAHGFGTHHSKTLILHYEHPPFNRTIHVVIVQESLGF